MLVCFRHNITASRQYGLVKFLIDTNVVIPLEPTSSDEVKQNTPVAAQFAGQAALGGHTLYVHPEIRADIRRDTNSTRRQTLELLIQKYPQLPDAPSITPRIKSVVGQADPRSNDWVDHLLLAALEADAVDILVTEDRELRSKAAQLDLLPRVATISEALSLIRDLFELSPLPPPAVQAVRAHALNSSDPIFQSFRGDYPDFDAWLIKCRREHRRCWIITGEKEDLAAVSIVKHEPTNEFGIDGKLLKICSFKVSELYNGFRYGELLLKAILKYAQMNKFDCVYVTVFDKYEGLLALLQEFGFQETTQRTFLGELVLSKPLCFTEETRAAMEPLAFNIRYGPNALKFDEVPTFVVPIQPRYHRLLFPDVENQLTLFPGDLPFGNAIRKAYLCNASNRAITPGSLLLFYRSYDLRALTCAGVVESTLVSTSPNTIARFVGKRTVYRFDR